MKKLLLVIPIFLTLLTCCGTTSNLIPSERKSYVFFLDFREYTEQGFLISPDYYQGKFKACGELSIIIHPAEKITKFGGKTNIYGVYEPATNALTREQISGKELLNLAVVEAKKIGANAIVNFKCNEVSNSYFSAQLGKNITEFSHYEISGFCINIE